MDREGRADAMTTTEFLQAFHPGGPWVLTAITPDRKSIKTVTFGPSTQSAAEEWIAEGDGKANLYFNVNLVRQPITKKATREDISIVPWLHVDIDARAGEPLPDELERIRVLLEDNCPVPPPTFIVFSGGGFQAFWKLSRTVNIRTLQDAEELSRYNQQLEIVLGGDSCHNIDRIMRLPNTMNLPDAKKVAKGRIPARARVHLYDPTRVYDLSLFTQAQLVQMPNGDTNFVETPTANVPRLESVDELDKWSVPDRVKVIIVQGHHPDECKTGDSSRSAWLFDAVCHLLRTGVPDDTILGVITDSNFGISASVLDKGRNAEKYAMRQIERAREMATEDFQQNDKGTPYANQHNIRLAIRKLGYTLAFDMFADRLLLNGEHLDDAAITRLFLETERHFGFRPAKDYFWMTTEDAARANAFHPVRDYLDGLKWDGTPRLDRWLIHYAGVKDSVYTRAVGSLVLIAAVRRVRSPGCRFDEMLVLEGGQGTLKSSALAILAVQEEWFSDDLPLGADSKRVIEALAGRWIVEAAELKGMRKSDIEHLKSFLSRRIDRARMAYGRLITEVPRQGIIVGTTNSERYLRDGTGNRRFWPVRTGTINLDDLRADRDLLWAEAACREREGANIRLAPELWDAAGVEQEQRRVEDPFISRLAAVLRDLNGKLKTEDAWTVVGVPPGQRTQDHNARLGEALRELGWERTKRSFDGVSQWCYVRGTEDDRKRAIHVFLDDQGDIQARPVVDHQGDVQANRDVF
jgi:predicted P-loop ATPase